MTPPSDPPLPPWPPTLLSGSECAQLDDAANEGEGPFVPAHEVYALRDALLARLLVAVDALVFYADKDSYNCTQNEDGADDPDIWIDKGDEAREALARIGPLPTQEAAAIEKLDQESGNAKD